MLWRSSRGGVCRPHSEMTLRSEGNNVKHLSLHDFGGPEAKVWLQCLKPEV